MVKGGYFPLPPVDSSQDIRSTMCNIMEEMGLVVEALRLASVPCLIR